MSTTIIVMRSIETKEFKITVEEIDTPYEQRFITTYWDKTDCREEDRKVYEWETYGGAMVCAFDLLAAEVKI